VYVDGSLEPVNQGSLAPPGEVEARLVELWAHGRSPHTQRAYQADWGAFRAFSRVPLHQVTLGDVQAYADHLTARGLAPASRARRLAAVKSLFTFALSLGVLRVNPAAPIRLPPVRARLAERILSEADVHRMLALTTRPRNHALLLLLYAAGLRVSEACSLRWRDLTPRTGEETGQVTVWGKGAKERTVLLPASVWRALTSLRTPRSLENDPVFTAHPGVGAPLSTSQAGRVVRAAARRAGITANVSPHWLRHAHASHALDRGAPASLVQATLGHAALTTTGLYLHARPNDSSARYLAL
jgi:integrase/recombinase XerD